MLCQHMHVSLPLIPQRHSICVQLLTSDLSPLSPDPAVTHRSRSSLQRSPEDSSSYSHPPPAGSSLHGGTGWSGMGYSPLQRQTVWDKCEFIIDFVQGKSITKVPQMLTNYDRQWASIMLFNIRTELILEQKKSRVGRHYVETRPGVHDFLKGDILDVFTYVVPVYHDGCSPGEGQGAASTTSSLSSRVPRWAKTLIN